MALNKITKASLSGFLLVIFIIVTLLFLSYDARDWVAVYILTSEVTDAPALPPFSVPPKDSGRKYVEFIAIGDAGTGAFGQRLTAEAMRKKADHDSISFVLCLGDNFYEFGVRSTDDQQWKDKFERMYTSPSLNVPFYAVLGNHDYRQNPQAQVEYTRKTTRWNMPDRFYTFIREIDDSASAKFFCLDTQPMAYLRSNDLSIGKDSAKYMPQLRWLEKELSESSARWKIVLGHHPLYSNGEHGNNKELASLLEPFLVRHAVDFYLSGHEHDLQLLKPVKGVNYVISGGGGKHRDVAWRDNTLYAGTNLGFAFFRISHTDAIVEFINREGITQYVHRFSKDFKGKGTSGAKLRAFRKKETNARSGRLDSIKMKGRSG